MDDLVGEVARDSTLSVAQREGKIRLIRANVDHIAKMVQADTLLGSVTDTCPVVFCVARHVSIPQAKIAALDDSMI